MHSYPKVGSLGWAWLIFVLAYQLSGQIPEHAPLSPAIPDTILAIEGLQGRNVQVKNNSNRNITGWAIQMLGPADSPHYSDVASTDRSLGTPLAPGQTDSSTYIVDDDLVPSNLSSQLRVVAVLFDDGTHVGHALNRAYGEDVVAELLEQRKGRADAWAYWADVLSNLPANDHDAVQQFLAKASTLPSVPVVGERHVTTSKTFAQSATEFVNAGIRHLAAQVRDQQANGHDEAWVRNNLLAPFARHAQQATNITKAAALDNGEAKGITLQ